MKFFFILPLVVTTKYRITNYVIYLLDKVYFTYKTAVSIKVEGNRGGGVLGKPTIFRRLLKPSNPITIYIRNTKSWSILTGYEICSKMHNRIRIVSTLAVRVKTIAC